MFNYLQKKKYIWTRKDHMLVRHVDKLKKTIRKVVIIGYINIKVNRKIKFRIISKDVRVTKSAIIIVVGKIVIIIKWKSILTRVLIW